MVYNVSDGDETSLVSCRAICQLQPASHSEMRPFCLIAKHIIQQLDAITECDGLVRWEWQIEALLTVPCPPPQVIHSHWCKSPFMLRLQRYVYHGFMKPWGWQNWEIGMALFSTLGFYFGLSTCQCMSLSQTARSSVVDIAVCKVCRCAIHGVKRRHAHWFTKTVSQRQISRQLGRTRFNIDSEILHVAWLKGSMSNFLVNFQPRVIFITHHKKRIHIRKCYLFLSFSNLQFGCDLHLDW